MNAAKEKSVFQKQLLWLAPVISLLAGWAANEFGGLSGEEIPKDPPRSWTNLEWCKVLVGSRAWTSPSMASFGIDCVEMFGNVCSGELRIILCCISLSFVFKLENQIFRPVQDGLCVI